MQTLCAISVDTYHEHEGNLMGCTLLKNAPNRVKVYDNWVNRIELGVKLPLVQSKILDTPEWLRTKALLKDFQLHDVEVMSGSAFALNRNRMGTGKTVEFIALCQALDCQKILVVCPKAVIPQWVAQFKAWWPERAKDVVTLSTKKIPASISSTAIVVTNYEKLLNKSIKALLKYYVWDIVGCDEAHYIKNRTAQRTKAVKEIPAMRRNAMTGTPVLRNPDDLYSIFQWLSPVIPGSSYWRFAEYFCNIEEDFYGRHVRGLTKNEAHVEVLKKLLAQLSVYNAVEVAQGKRHIPCAVEVEPKQKKLYNKIRALLLEELPDTLTIPNGAVMLTRLIQTTSCPGVFAQNQGDTYGWGGKFDWIHTFLEVDPETKVVVYSKFAQVIDCLKNFLTQKGIGIVTYTGQQSSIQNEAAKKKFVDDPKVQVLAGTIDAMGTGIDGLQKVCNVCIFIDRDSRPEINAQAEDRLHRTGQDKEVLCYYLECESTCDQKVAQTNWTRTEDIRKLLEVQP